MPTEIQEFQQKAKGKAAFTSEPKGQDWKDIKAKRIEPTYQCSRCNRTHHVDSTQIVLLAGKYYCLEHFRDARLEMAYNDPPFADDWREKEIAAIAAAHPEWQRQSGETRSEYQGRMIQICREKLRRLNERMKS